MRAPPVPLPHGFPFLWSLNVVLHEKDRSPNEKLRSRYRFVHCSKGPERFHKELRPGRLHHEGHKKTRDGNLGMAVGRGNLPVALFERKLLH